jgi:hypothetical protein
LLAAGSKMSRREYEQWRDAHTWDPSRETELIIQSDLAPAAWLEPLLVPDSFEVRMTVPQGFEAYARIFFPFAGADIVHDGVVVGQEHITWTEMARRSGRIAHALMEQETIQRGSETCCGELAERTTRRAAADSDPAHLVDARLVPALGWVRRPQRAGVQLPRAKVRHPMRHYYLLQGPLTSFGDFPHDPSYWWPDDRAWCWCTDVDFDWGYLAGSAACIDEVLAARAVDALATRAENPAHSGMDIVNDPDGAVPRSP